jgi:hypothetical protein
MKKKFEALRARMTAKRQARADERAQEMLEELLHEGLIGGDYLLVDDVYWESLRSRVADQARQKDRSSNKGIKETVLGGPSLEGVDLDRDQSPMRDNDL